MKLRELIESLKDLDPELEVIMGDVNGYSPYSDFSVGKYQPETTWSGDFYTKDYYEFEEEDFKENAVCFHSIN